MSGSHYRQECEHGAVLSQCRCPAASKWVEVVRPCPQGPAHLGMVIKHPLPPATAVGTGLGQVAQDPAESPQNGLDGAGAPEDTPEPPGAGQGAAERAEFRRTELAKLLAFRYATPHVEHWENLTEAQRRYWRSDADMVLGYLGAIELAQR